jgi:DNA polymerase V
MLTFYTPAHTTATLPRPLFNSVRAGFPSPAEDTVERNLDLNQELISHPTATYFVRVDGDSMQDANILDGDILVVDKSLEPSNDDIVVALVDGEFTVKRISLCGDKILLIPENPSYKTLEITPEHDFSIWGVVTYILHKSR